MNPQVFFDWANGKYLDYDGYYGAQCVDMIQYYANFLGLHRFSGNAKDIINQADASYQRVSNPQKGDIVIIVPSPPNGYAGHVAIISQDGNGNATFGQNYPDGSPCHYQNVPDPKLGYLRPNNVNQGGDIGITQAQFDAAVASNQAASRLARRILVGQVYLFYLGRPPTDAEVDARQDQEPNFIVNDVKNSEEAQKYAQNKNTIDKQKILDFINNN